MQPIHVGVINVTENIEVKTTGCGFTTSPIGKEIPGVGRV